jgi:ergothioneine biosynthesis protein EgtB
MLASLPAPSPRLGADTLLGRYRAVRRFTEAFAAPLAVEDHVVQSMADVSPQKWHLAHTTWFFETFVLMEYGHRIGGYARYDEVFPYLFNSYYVQAGERHCRAQRGYLTRPTVAEVLGFRHAIDAHLERLLDGLDERTDDESRHLAEVVEIGLHHEQQHQELMATDLKHVFSVNPLRPAYHDRPLPRGADPGDARFVPFEAGVYEVGFEGTEAESARERFHFDNEGPRHRVFLEAFEIADRLVTNAEVLAFIEDGGYTRADLWLTEGFALAQEHGWTEPFYWERPGKTARYHDRDAEGWATFTLGGMQPLDPHAPATHLSFFEADAVARWMGARLPTEFEWEVAARRALVGLSPTEAPGTFADAGLFHPAPVLPADAVGGDGAAATRPEIRQLFGEAWQWTGSAYRPYPGYQPAPGALGEYNGKFMSSQFVLRGASCATSRSHARLTYRNFFHPDATWQFTGLRLARSR